MLIPGCASFLPVIRQSLPTLFASFCLTTLLPLAATAEGVKPNEAPPADAAVETKTYSDAVKKAPEVQPEITPLAQPILSPNDDRQMRHFMLPNGLPVLIISDPDTDKAAAALDVNVGSGEDPKDRAGLAHFLEHMLFLGTKKYPEADQYQDYIQKRGGSHNAYTSYEHTNYFFDIQAEHLAGALDRFAQFFISPLFNEAYVERERNAVHSEFRAKYSSEFRRQEDVLRQLVNPEHTFAKFRTGNLATLHNDKGNLRQDLLAFYRQYYSATNMRLVVAGKDSLDDLEALVTSLFSAVPRFEVIEPNPSKAMFPADFLPASVEILPNTEVRSVSYIFPVDKYTDWMKKPLAFIGHLLGHEAEGSLAWLLKKEGLIESLSAGQGYGWRTGDTFMVNIKLLPKGLAQLPLIDQLLFDYVEMIKRGGIEPWRFEEIKNLGEVDFLFKERGDTVSEVSHLATKLHQIPASQLFTVDYRFSEFDKSLIQHYADALNKKNVFRIVTAPEIKPESQTDLYEVPYRLQADYQPAQDVTDGAPEKNALQTALKLPEKNPFVPEDLSLVEGFDEKPQPVVKHSRFNAWHAVDTRFGTPRATLRIRLKSAFVESSAEQAAMAKLLADAISEDLNPVTYQAYLAGADFSVSASSRGLDFTFSGYSDSLEPLVEYVLAEVKRLGKGRGIVSDHDRLEDFRDSLVRRYSNQKKNAPYQQLTGFLAASLYSPYYTADAMAKALAEVDVKSLEDFTESLLKNSEVTVLSAGNLSEKSARKLAKKIKRVLVRGRSFKPRSSASVSLVEGAYGYDIEAQHKDNALMVYLQGEDDSFDHQAKVMLLAQSLSTPFYASLRTEQQLGYIVFASYYPIREMPGAVFIVQSPTYDAADILAAIKDFAVKYTPDFETEFRAHQLAVVSQLAEAPKNLNEQVSKFWQSVNNDDWNFDREDKLIKAIEALEPKAFAEWYRAFFERTLLAKSPRAMVFYANGDSESAKAINAPFANNLSDLDAFKAKTPSKAYP